MSPRGDCEIFEIKPSFLFLLKRRLIQSCKTSQTTQLVSQCFARVSRRALVGALWALAPGWLVPLCSLRLWLLGRLHSLGVARQEMKLGITASTSERKNAWISSVFERLMFIVILYMLMIVLLYYLVHVLRGWISFQHIKNHCGNI